MLNIVLKPVKEALNKWSEEGMTFPFVKDVSGDRPSVTLLFFYVSYLIGQFFVTISSYELMRKGSFLIATFMPVVMVVLTYVFYRFHQLSKVSFDFDDKQLSIEGSSQRAKKTTKTKKESK